MALAALRKQPQTVANDDRVDPQVQLVDEVAFEEPTEQLPTAVDLELASGLGFQVSDSRFDVTIDLAITATETEDFPVMRVLRDVELTAADMAFVNGAA